MEYEKDKEIRGNQLVYRNWLQNLILRHCLKLRVRNSRFIFCGSYRAIDVEQDNIQHSSHLLCTCPHPGSMLREKIFLDCGKVDPGFN
jgi:hypothetical protein